MVKHKRAFILKQKMKRRIENRLGKPVKIYDTLLAIWAIKSPRSNFPGEKFVHKFSQKTKAAVYGLGDGSLLIKGKRPLWRVFKYSKDDLK